MMNMVRSMLLIWQMVVGLVQVTDSGMLMMMMMMMMK